MANACCNLVGNFPDLGYDRIISVNVSSSTEMSRIEDVIITGPSVGTVSITGYAQEDPYQGCPGRAGASFNWIRKYECEGGTGTVHFIFAGEGQSYIFGEVGSLATLTELASYHMVSASSTSGPAALYTDATQSDGYQFSYDGDPISFSTGDEPTIITIDKIANGVDLYLQSFNLECNPGSIPTASYSFVFAVDN